MTGVLVNLGFTAPWLLATLLLPLLWLLLRAVPPAPVRRVFPGVVLLLRLEEDERASERTPWWLMLLRCLALAAVVIGLAGPRLYPEYGDGGTGRAQIIVADATWASAGSWAVRTDILHRLIDAAERSQAPVAMISATRPAPVVLRPAAELRQYLAGITPDPWTPDYPAVRARLTDAAIGPVEVVWLSDGRAHPGREELAAWLQARGNLRVVEPDTSRLALTGIALDQGQVVIGVSQLGKTPEAAGTVVATGLDPAGREARLAAAPVEFAPSGGAEAEVRFDLPLELRERLIRFSLDGEASAAAIRLVDDRLRRRKVALFGEAEGREGLEFLSPLHFLSRAMSPSTELLGASLTDAIRAQADAVILADVAQLAPDVREALTQWVEEGGLLLRFAGPRLAAASREMPAAEDPLMPVRLRAGGRTVGGSLSWQEPRSLAPFPRESPFHGLPIPADVRVTTQVLAQPDIELASRTMATLSDGTPLVTRSHLGEGQVVLFHVSANAEWSTLALSGLFVEMLERILGIASTAGPGKEEMAGTSWQPQQVLDAFGGLVEPDLLPMVDGEDLLSAPLHPDMPPGLYRSGNRSLARNVVEKGDAALTPAVWPSGISVEDDAGIRPIDLGWAFLSLSLVLLLGDLIAAAALSGRLPPAVVARRTGAAPLLLALVVALAPPVGDDARADSGIAAASGQLVLAHVLSGDDAVDRTAKAGLFGLSMALGQRTSVEPAQPVGIDVESDELAFYPLLYWPVVADQPAPSADAVARLNRYLATGGMIHFDTRDANIAVAGIETPEGRKLREIARGLEIPQLEPVPVDHVLTRTFYLLQDFPGRYRGGNLWIEAAPPGAMKIPGMPFRNLNDGVTPVVMGGNDWAGAWAITPDGRPMLPVGRSLGDERQRELALRFGINLVMYVLSGNYKSDQVHVPALLQRLGQ